VLKQNQGDENMSDFLFIYRGGEPGGGTPEQMQLRMQRWTGWLKDLGEKGHIKDLGNPLEPGGKVVKGKGKSITDGPFAEAKDLVGGYTLVQTKDLEHAAELATGCPIFDAGGFVEVRPIMKM
jgi:hypothetical protein